MQKLELSVCNTGQISIQVSVSLDDAVELLINSLTESGYNIFNENDLMIFA